MYSVCQVQRILPSFEEGQWSGKTERQLRVTEAKGRTPAVAEAEAGKGEREEMEGQIKGGEGTDALEALRVTKYTWHMEYT